jgi:hypothetical protein
LRNELLQEPNDYLAGKPPTEEPETPYTGPDNADCSRLRVDIALVLDSVIAEGSASSCQEAWGSTSPRPNPDLFGS